MLDFVNEQIINEIEEKKGQIKTENVIFSIGEIINLYKQKDLKLNPDFQRFYRWTTEQKSRLIESIFIGLPIPSLFVYEDCENIWEVLDGLQRISSLIEFVGELKDENGKILPALKLEGLQYLKTLENLTWNDIPEKLQRAFKKSTLPFIVMKNETTEIKKYQLFQRLNRGGTELTEAEVRNCIILMEKNGKNLMNAIDEMVQFKSFQKAINFGDRRKKEKADFDLVIRYLCFKFSDNKDLFSVDNVGDFLNNKIVNIASQNYNYQDTIEEFKEIFSSIVEQLDQGAFRRFNKEKNVFEGQFLMAQFEAVIYAILKTNNYANLREKLITLSENIEYQKYSAGGISVRSRWNNILEIAENIFSNE